MTESSMPYSKSGTRSDDDVVDDDLVDADASDPDIVDADEVDAEVMGVEAVDDGSEAVNTESVNDPQGVGPEDSGPTSSGGAASDSSAGAGSASGEAAGREGDLAAQRLEDLQRLNAEYVNYKRRVDRDREVVQQRALSNVLESLLPVLDDVHLAREHGDLTGPMAAIADKLQASVSKLGLESFGDVGEEFDPARHEALMHGPWDPSREDLPTDATTTTVVQVLQPGYRIGDQVIRPARVAVADPQ